MRNKKRNYIKRKKFLNDNIERIKKTLIFVKMMTNIPINDQEIDKKALLHAQSIEAACWSPHQKLTAKEYEEISAFKANELCHAITKKYIPNLTTPTLHHKKNNNSFNNHRLFAEEAKPIQKRPLTPNLFPIPIVPKSAPVHIANFDIESSDNNNFTIENHLNDIEFGDRVSLTDNDTPSIFEFDSNQINDDLESNNYFM